MRNTLRGACRGAALNESERILDAAIECTFPASDPIAVQSAFEAACEREREQPLEITDA